METHQDTENEAIASGTEIMSLEARMKKARSIAYHLRRETQPRKGTPSIPRHSLSCGKSWMIRCI